MKQGDLVKLKGNDTLYIINHLTKLGQTDVAAVTPVETMDWSMTCVYPLSRLEKCNENG
jgi:hypothetical protein